MSVELKRLIEKVSHMDITLLAGANGMSNIVTWVHMIETKEASSFLEGGEIAFTTGIGLRNELSLLELIESIWRNQASGVILNIGPFLESVPKEVVDFGNEHDFPIFQVPWRIHIAEIMRIFSYTITRYEQINTTIASAFKNAIFFPEQEELYLVALSQNGFNINWSYQVCLINVTNQNNISIDNNRLTQLIIYIDNYLQHRKYVSYAIFSHDTYIALVLANYTEQQISSIVDDLKEYLKLYLQKTEQYFMGVGRSTKSIRCLYKSYNQAINIQALQQKGKISRSMITYSKMGIYKLLMAIEDADILNEYYEKTIKPLVVYDGQNDSNLCEVLKVYIKHNGSVKETADELFVHRNTVNYKLNKTEDILQVNLSDLDTRVQLSLGFMIQDML